MKNIIYIAIIALLLLTSILFWYRSHELSNRLALIQERIEASRKEKMVEGVKEEIRQAPYKARVAIVLDDWGYNLKNLKAVRELNAPVTLSILPNLPYSRRIAKAAKEKKIEVILHLPLEPYENMRLEKITIMTDMTDKEILDNLEKAISSVPGLKGISNHMGSRATEDERVMSLIFERMKQDNLYFLDSLVTTKSVCRDLSRRIGIKFASRSVFLDNEADAEYIKGQVEELANQALQTDWAVGVGHDRALTLEVIKEMIPILNNLGIEIVLLSQILE